MPVDMMAIVKAGQSLVPDIRAQLIQDDERRAMSEQREVLNEQRRVATDAAQEKQARQQQLRVGLNQAVLSSDPRAITRLMAQFPEYADQIKPGWEALRAEERQANQTQVGTAYVRGQNGDFKGAAAALQQRYDADAAAKHQDPHTKELIDELNSDDPKRQRIAVSTLGIYLSADDPNKFAQLYPDLQREARLQELQPSEVAIKDAEAENAAGYYTARASKTRSEATTAASNARYADAKNAAQVERTDAGTANLMSLMKRRAAILGKRPEQLTVGDLDAPTLKPAAKRAKGAREITATDGKGNRIRYNLTTKQWEPL